jgi:hypothetical protein
MPHTSRRNVLKSRLEPRNGIGMFAATRSGG